MTPMRYILLRTPYEIILAKDLFSHIASPAIFLTIIGSHDKCQKMNGATSIVSIRDEYTIDVAQMPRKHRTAKIGASRR